MPFSMTGFGAAEGDVADRRLQVEIRTVNHRWFHLAARLPPELGSLEGDLREALRREFDRGHVSVTVRWVDDGGFTAAIDWERAEAVVAALRDLRDRFGFGGEVSLELVARQADIFGLRRTGDEAVAPWDALAPIVAQAAADCRAARLREGWAMVAELRDRLERLEAAADRIATRAPVRLLRERHRLQTNLAQLLEGRPVDDDRVEQELALAADRLDITE